MRKIHELFDEQQIDYQEKAFLVPGYHYYGNEEGKGVRVNILAMGDVGGTLALAMKLTSRDIVSEIGICDINKAALQRWEQELNQIVMPEEPDAFPPVRIIDGNDTFDCDVFVFCASRGVPDLSQKDIDVRMVQLEKNRELVSAFAEQAVAADFAGEFFVVSDPVDPLCKAAVEGGIDPHRVQGFGLGVMFGRARYYAQQDETLQQFLTEGRVFGPHGEDLVVADSITDYDDKRSMKLTKLTTSANLRVRELGFKPYIAPAVSSGALSILENLRGHWHYSSVWFGNAFLGVRNRRTAEGLLVENLPLDDVLFDRIEKAYRNLEAL